MTQPIRKTERLTLRRWRDADHAPFAEICADRDVMRFIGDGSTRSAEQASRAIDTFERGWDTNGFGLFAVELNDSGEFIGFAGLASPTFLPEILPSVEIGWRLGKRHWGAGYASEAAREVVAFGVGDLGLADIVSICQLGNHASRRIMQKIGMLFDRQTVDPSCGRAVEVYRLPSEQRVPDRG